MLPTVTRFPVKASENWVAFTERPAFAQFASEAIGTGLVVLFGIGVKCSADYTQAQVCAAQNTDANLDPEGKDDCTKPLGSRTGPRCPDNHHEIIEPKGLQ